MQRRTVCLQDTATGVARMAVTSSLRNRALTVTFQPQTECRGDLTQATVEAEARVHRRVARRSKVMLPSRCLVCSALWVSSDAVAKKYSDLKPRSAIAGLFFWPTLARSFLTIDGLFLRLCPWKSETKIDVHFLSAHKIKGLCILVGLARVLQFFHNVT